MHIQLQNLGKRFNRDWIFRNIDFDIPSASKLSILGSNGSGKSTLLRIISGYFSVSEGSINYSYQGVPVPIDEVYKKLSIAAPYLDIPGLFTLEEAVEFHFKFKSPAAGLDVEQIIQKSGLAPHRNKQIKHFSSGMKQRLRLSLAIMSDVPLVLLDEPSSNLDATAVQWYRDLVKEQCQDKTLIVCSNHELREYDFCDKVLEIKR
jgi:ABC-type multidrug transport system ATPase subunit